MTALVKTVSFASKMMSLEPRKTIYAAAVDTRLSGLRTADKMHAVPQFLPQTSYDNIRNRRCIMQFLLLGSFLPALAFKEDVSEFKRNIRTDIHSKCIDVSTI